jgi:hypothetical protein
MPSPPSNDARREETHGHEVRARRIPIVLMISLSNLELIGRDALAAKRPRKKTDAGQERREGSASVISREPIQSCCRPSGSGMATRNACRTA